MFETAKTGKPVLFAGAALLGLGIATAATQGVFAEPSLTLTGSCNPVGGDKEYDGTPAVPATYEFTFDVTGADDVFLQNYEVQFADISGAASRDVGSNLAVTAVTLGGTNAGNLTLTTPIVISSDPTSYPGCDTVSILPKQLDINGVVAQDKVYNGNTSATLNRSNHQLSGVVAGDVVNLSVANAVGTFDNKNVGTRTVTTSGFSIDNNNYRLNELVLSADITKAPSPEITVSGSKDYGDTSGSYSFTANGLVSGDSIGSVDYDVSNNGLSATASRGDYPLTSSNPTGGNFDSDNYEAVIHTPGTFSVNRRDLDITAKPQTKIYGAPFSFNGDEFTTSGIQNGETISSASFSVSDNADSQTDADVDTYTVSVSSAVEGSIDFNNYNVAYFSNDFDVVEKDLTVTLTTVRKDYGTQIGGQAVSFNGFMTASGLVGTEAIQFANISSDGQPASANAGTYVGSIVQGSLDGINGFKESNYNITFGDGDYIVDPLAVDVLVGSSGTIYKTYGDELFDGAGKTSFHTSSVLPNDDFISSVTLTYADGNDESDPAATYSNDVQASAATGSGFRADNYSFSYPTGDVVVEQRDLTIKINVNVEKTYGDTITFSSGDTRFELTSGSYASGEGISSMTMSSTGASATARVEDVHEVKGTNLVGTGNFTEGNYDIEFIKGEITVTKASLVITSEVSDTKVYGETKTYGDQETRFTYSGARNSNVIDYVTMTSGGSDASAAVDTSFAVTINDWDGSSGFEESNYSISTVPGTLTVNRAPIDISASYSKTYGDEGPATLGSGEFSIVSGSLKSGETITSIDISSDGSDQDSDVGDYAMTLSNPAGSGFVASNYVVTFSPGSYSVTRRSATIKADDVTKVFGDPALTFGAGQTAFSADLVNGDSITITITAEGGTQPTDAVGDYYLRPSAPTGADALNYSFGFTDGTLTVNRKTVTVSLTTPNGKKEYGDIYPVGDGETAIDVVGMLSGDSITSVTTDSAGAGALADVDDYPITLSDAVGSFSSANYKIEYNDGELEVEKADLTITSTIDDTKVYGVSQTFSGNTSFRVGEGQLKNDETIESVTMLSDGSPADAPVKFAGGIASLSNDNFEAYDVVPSDAVGGSSVTDGKVWDVSNYEVIYVPGSLKVIPAELTVAAKNAEKVYGEVWSIDEATDFTANGLKNGEQIDNVTITASGGLEASESVASSPYTLTPSQATGTNFVATNYDITYVPGSLKVNAAVITVTAKDASKVYGEELEISQTNGFTVTGLKNGEVIAAVDIAASGGLSANSGVIGSPYTLTPSNARGPVIVPQNGSSFLLSNYVIEYVAGELTVSPLEISIIPSNLSKTVGDEIVLGADQDGFEVDVDPLPNGDTITSVTLASNGAGDDAAEGIYPLRASSPQGSFTASNYDITYVPGVIVVNAAPVSGGGGGTVVVQAPVVTDSSVAGTAGAEITLSGANLNLVRSVTVGGENAAIVSSTTTSITFSVPELDEGSASIVLSYLGGQIEYASILTVEATEDEASNDESNPATETNYWTTALSESEIKMYAKNIIGLGKVQFFHNGEEVAWVNAEDASDPKLRVIESGPMEGANYLVRTRALVPGKNIFEIYVDGVRVERRSQGF